MYNTIASEYVGTSRNFVKSDISKPRYRCKRYAYSVSIDKLQHGIGSYYVKKAIKLYLVGRVFKAVERVAGASHVSVTNWVKKYGEALEKVENSEQNMAAIELDAAWVVACALWRDIQIRM